MVMARLESRDTSARLFIALASSSQSRQSGCDPRLWRRSSSSDGPKPTSELKMWQGNPTPKACDPIRTAARRVRIEQAGFYATDLLNSDTAIAASMAAQISDRL